MGLGDIHAVLRRDVVPLVHPAVNRHAAVGDLDGSHISIGEEFLRLQFETELPVHFHHV